MDFSFLHICLLTNLYSLNTKGGFSLGRGYRPEGYKLGSGAFRGFDRV